MNKQLRILILEDNVVDAELMERELHRAEIEFKSRRVDTKEDFQRELADFTPDLSLRITRFHRSMAVLQCR